jgi:hypothetical protein
LFVLLPGQTCASTMPAKVKKLKNARFTCPIFPDRAGTAASSARIDVHARLSRMKKGKNRIS